ncbi:septum formation initiator family protein [Bacillus sp. BRMEA1]|uniref:FtsB family cell division protein n=1 Tax=Neobacillus endophyticus TaxID=2738405 RepID=UPI0015655E72|nr:septum formation initiator family protein [Neobacillus endophyticus]NRD77480.1 septum formation initiator family protein [Neobacillus endophyticus]
MGAVQNQNVSKMETTYVKQQEYAEIASARKRKLLLRRLSMFFVLAGCVSYLLISQNISQTAELKTKMVQKKQLESQLSALKHQQSTLKQEIVNLNDDDYIAKLARKEYFFSDKNEIIFNIPEDKKGN